MISHGKKILFYIKIYLYGIWAEILQKASLRDRKCADDSINDNLLLRFINISKRSSYINLIL